LCRLGRKEPELATRRKNDPVKPAIAARLRKETTLSIKSIATRGQLGTLFAWEHLIKSTANRP
jgi:hypothetical protein